MADETKLSELNTVLKEFTENVDAFIKLMKRTIAEKQEQNTKRRKKLLDDILIAAPTLQDAVKKGFVSKETMKQFGKWAEENAENENNGPVFDLVIGLAKYKDEEAQIVELKKTVAAETEN